MKSKSNNKKCFLDRHVVIIGATGGLGKAYTKMFLDEGAHVYLGARSPQKLSETYSTFGDQVKIGMVDVQSPDSIADFAKNVQKDFNHIDYVINAIGYDVRKELFEHTKEDIQNSIDINLTGSIYISRYFLPLLKEQSESTIVHMGGFVDGALAFPYYSVDVATRAGLYSFCESMNRELKQEGHKYHMTYFCPNPADTKAEQPYHPIWKEMKTKISSTEEVAFSLKMSLLKEKKVSIMGGALESGFAKLNHLSTSLSDMLLMNWYSRILQKYLSKKNINYKITPETHFSDNITQNKYTPLAIGLIVFSFISYLGVILLPCLDISTQCKFILFTLINILSWGTFFLGSLLGGKEFLRKICHK